MIKNLIYIAILFFSSITFAKSSNIITTQAKQSFEVLDSDFTVSDLYTEEFADNTDEDTDKHMVCLLKILKLISQTEKSYKIIPDFSTQKFHLLNTYLDLPPPGCKF